MFVVAQEVAVVERLHPHVFQKVIALYDERGGKPFHINRAYCGGKPIVGDHAWLEVYFKDTMLFIDPTIAQYGKVQGIAHERFTIGDPEIKKQLREKYGIIDNRLSILVRKYTSHIPNDQPPYPGMGIDPKDAEYFLHIADTRNIVSLGREPESWKPWVEELLKKYN